MTNRERKYFTEVHDQYKLKPSVFISEEKATDPKVFLSREYINRYIKILKQKQKG